MQGNGDWGGCYHERGNKKNPLRKLFIADRPDGTMEPTMNLLLHHGVRSALEYVASGELAKAHAVSNPQLAPHLEFVDLGGHGCGVVRVNASRMATNFVCIPRPIERAAMPDGGPLRYRVQHEVPLWCAGDAPTTRQSLLERDSGPAV